MTEMLGSKILVIDDDPNMLRLVTDALSKTGAHVYTAASGEEGLRQFYAFQPHLVLLDIMMPDLDGWQLRMAIHQLSGVPVIFLTALGKEKDIVRGLDCGAVDYVTKPFSPKVLAARVRSALRQAERASVPEKPLSYNDGYLTVDLDGRQVLLRGEPVKLTRTEYRLLAYLLRNAGRVLTFQQILDNVWGWEYQESVEYVHVYIWHLRQKLERDPKHPQYLLSERGVGYRFQNHPPQADWHHSRLINAGSPR
jgi:two-component system KDP operon response regulator KdpE